MMGLPDGRKGFKIGLAVLIQYRRVTSSQLPSQPRCRSKYRAYFIARVKSDFKKILEHNILKKFYTEKNINVPSYT